MQMVRDVEFIVVSCSRTTVARVGPERNLIDREHARSPSGKDLALMMGGGFATGTPAAEARDPEFVFLWTNAPFC